MTPAAGSTCTRCGARLGSGAFFCPRCGTGIPVPLAGAPTVATSPADAEGRPDASDAQLDALRQATLGQYEILFELGHGGMATVYLAHDLALDRKVAIKVLAPALLLMGEGMVERFKREARTAAALSHPHIIPIYAVRESDQVLYFVMKHVQGRPLDLVVRDVGPLPIAMTQAILAQVGDALSYAHRHGVIHRDIKSANIMLDEEGWAVVTDFGIAKVLQAQGLTMTGVTVGTPTYMSPEQCATEEVTGASDQCSPAVVAYAVLTCALPFQDESIMSVIYADFSQPPRPVNELRPDCPPNLAAAVMRMLEKDPARRWPSMDDVVAISGRPSLRHDDPIRLAVITLARAGPHAAVKTPTSPLVLSKVRTRVTGRGTPRRWLWAAIGVASAALAFGLWRAAPWLEPRITPPVAVPKPVFPDSSVSAHPAPPPARHAPVPAGTTADAIARAAQRDDSVIRSLRSSALTAAQRAAEAGATPADLSAGNTAFARAESLATARRISEAVMQFASAASLWADAERLSRSRATRDSESRRVAAIPPTPLPAPAPPPAAPAAAVPVDPRTDIQKVVDEYARALESRDIEQVKRAYPGLTAAQQDSWQRFFDRVRNLKASLSVSGISVAGATADVLVSGTYEYDNAGTGRPEQRPVTFRATVTRDANGWRLTTIR